MKATTTRKHSAKRIIAGIFTIAAIAATAAVTLSASASETLNPSGTAGSNYVNTFGKHPGESGYGLSTEMENGKA